MMKAYLISILILALLVHGSRQSEKDPLDCSYKRKYSAEQRMKFYPFNSSDNVKLVSFRCHNNLPINRDGFIADSLLESTTVNKSDLDKLTDIFYNNFYRRYSNIHSITQCFHPRNAILFLDKKGNLLEYMLICFYCDRQEISSEKVETGDDCNQKIGKLRAFFSAQGLKYGTNRDTVKYPGETCGEEEIIHPPK